MGTAVLILAILVSSVWTSLSGPEGQLERWGKSQSLGKKRWMVFLRECKCVCVCVCLCVCVCEFVHLCAQVSVESHPGLICSHCCARAAGVPVPR